MTLEDFNNQTPTFISTGENTSNHKFDVSQSPNVAGGSKLDVTATATKQGSDTLTGGSNEVDINENLVGGGGGNGGGGEPPTEQRIFARTNGFALLPDVTYWDDLYGLGDGILGAGVHDPTVQTEAFNPEPTTGYPARTNLLNMTPEAFVGENVTVKSPWYFTLFETEGAFGGLNEHYIFAEDHPDQSLQGEGINLPRVVRIDIDAICGPAGDMTDKGRIGRALDAKYYYGDGNGGQEPPNLDGMFLQMDLEGDADGPFAPTPEDPRLGSAPGIIEIIERAGVYWNHPEFDRTPWTLLRGDMIETCNRLREKFPGVFVTWYACPRLPLWLSINRDFGEEGTEGDPFPGIYPMPPDSPDQANAVANGTWVQTQWSNIIPKDILGSSWQENLYNKMKQSFFDAMGPVMEAFDAYHLRYYVNRSVSNPEYQALADQGALLLSKSDTAEPFGVLTDEDVSFPIAQPDSEHVWSQQKDCVLWCREFNQANGLDIPIIPTTAPYTVGGAACIADYGVNTITLPDITGLVGGDLQVWKNNVELLFNNGAYSVEDHEDGFDTTVRLTDPVEPTDTIRVNYRPVWNGTSIIPGVPQASKWDDPAGLEGIYDSRLINIASYDDKITKVWGEIKPDAVFWWTSGAGIFPSWSMDNTRTSYNDVPGAPNRFQEARKPTIGTWYGWMDLNYVTGGWLFGDDERLQTARGFWDNKDGDGNSAPVGAGPLAEDPTIRNKWVTTWANYVNSHYAQPIVDAVKAGDGSVPPRFWSTYDFDTNTWDDISTGAMIVQDVFFTSDPPTFTSSASGSGTINFTVNPDILTESTPAISLAANRKHTKLKITFADGSELTTSQRSMDEVGGMNFFISGLDEPPQTFSGSKWTLLDFYPAEKPPSALNSAIKAAFVNDGIHQVPEEFPTIQEAIDASSDGDIVQVADGIYHEAINFKRKKITVRGNIDLPTLCIIDGIKEDGSGPVEAPWSRPSSRPELVSLVTVDTREPGQCYDNDNPADDELPDATFTRANRVLEGFKIQNATAGTRYAATEPGCEPCSFNNGCDPCEEDCVGPDAPINCIEAACPGAGIDGFVGGGLWAYRSKFTVRNCVFEDNESDGGGGAFVRECDVDFSSCTFRNNTSRSNGGGLQLNHCVSIVNNCTFDSNSANGSAFNGIGHGGGLHHFSGQVAISDCIFSLNTCTGQGGGLDMNTGLVLAFAPKHGDSSILDTTISTNTTTSRDDCGGLFINAREGDVEGVADATVSISATSFATTIICTNSNNTGDSNLCLNADDQGESLDGMIELDTNSFICP